MSWGGEAFSGGSEEWEMKLLSALPLSFSSFFWASESVRRGEGSSFNPLVNKILKAISPQKPEPMLSSLSHLRITTAYDNRVLWWSWSPKNLFLVVEAPEREEGRKINRISPSVSPAFSAFFTWTANWIELILFFLPFPYPTSVTWWGLRLRMSEKGMKALLHNTPPPTDERAGGD